MREARIHVRRLRDLLSTSFESSAHSAADNLSLSFSVAVSGVGVEGIICWIGIPRFSI